MDKFGMLIKQNRIDKNESRSDLADSIGCKESFVKHIESSDIVPISQRLVDALRKHYRIKKDVIEKFAKKRNSVGKAYFKEYRKRAAG